MAFIDNLNDVIQEREAEEKKKERDSQLIKEYYARQLDSKELDKCASDLVDSLKQTLEINVRNKRIYNAGLFGPLSYYFYEATKRYKWNPESYHDIHDGTKLDYSVLQRKHLTAKSTGYRDEITITCNSVSNFESIINRTVQMLSEEGLNVRHRIRSRHAKISIILPCHKDGTLKN